jgi:hypothetical protein
LRLALDTHASLAFAAGSILNIKTGRKIDLEQRTIARRVWSADDADPDPAWPRAAFNVVDLANGKPDIAVAIGLTHDIAADVRAFVERALPNVGRILVCQPSTGPSTLAVAGTSRFDLAIGPNLRDLSAGQPAIHVFAAPVLYIFLGGGSLPREAHALRIRFRERAHGFVYLPSRFHYLLTRTRASHAHLCLKAQQMTSATRLIYAHWRGLESPCSSKPQSFKKSAHGQTDAVAPARLTGRLPLFAKTEAHPRHFVRHAVDVRRSGAHKHAPDQSDRLSGVVADDGAYAS